MIFFCYKDIGNKEFFTMAALLMPLLENVENSTRSITLLLIGIVTLYTMCMPRWDTSRTNLNVWIVGLWPFWVFPFWDCCMTGWDCYQNIWLSIQTKWIGIVVSNHSKEKLEREKKPLNARVWWKNNCGIPQSKYPVLH